MKTSLVTIILFIGLAVAGYFFLNKKSSLTLESSPSPLVTTTPMKITELKIEIIAEGSGNPAKAGDTISALYEGRTLDGTVFDASSRHGNEPFSFVLGAGRVIKGWDQGLIGAKNGEKLRLSIPAELAYGKEDLIFEVEVVGITPAK